MRKHLWLFALVALLAASPAAADNSFGLFGTFYDTEDVDSSAGGGIRTRLGWLDLRASFLNDLTRDTSPERLDFELQAVPLEAGVAFNFMENGAWSPYAGGGVSYMMLDSDEVEIDDEAGFYAVAGQRLRHARQPQLHGRGDLPQHGGAGGPRPRNLSEIDDITLEEESAVELGGLGVNAGLSWRF